MKIIKRLIFGVVGIIEFILVWICLIHWFGFGILLTIPELLIKDLKNKFKRRG